MSTKTQADIDYAKRKKNQPSAKARESFKNTLEKTARKMGAKGWVRI